jgi:hypothetical protein
VLRLPVAREVEHRRLVRPAEREIAAGRDQLVAERAGHRHRLAGGRDDRRLADQIAALLAAGLGDADHPRRVLIGARLHRQLVVEVRERVVLRRGRVVERRVVAEKDHLHALQAHHAVGLRPPAVVADAHAEHAAEGAPHAEAQVADLEVSLLEVLERAIGLVLGVAGQVDLAVFPDQAPAGVDEDRGVVPMSDAALDDELRVAEIEAETEPRCLLEQRARLGPGHLALEERVDLRLILHPPARKERGEGELREDHQVATPGLGLVQMREQAFDDGAARLGPGNRSELRGADRDDAHAVTPGCSRGAWRRTPPRPERSCGRRRG